MTGPKIHYDPESQMWLASYDGLGFGAKTLQAIVAMWPADWPHKPMTPEDRYDDMMRRFPDTMSYLAEH